jgi:hypothetical protein
LRKRPITTSNERAPLTNALDLGRFDLN